MGGSMLLGWVSHFMIGAVLAIGYAAEGRHEPLDQRLGCGRGSGRRGGRHLGPSCTGHE
jgi:hypothetical protein